MTLAVFVGLSILYGVFPWKLSVICFGDLCPDNGGLYVVYRHKYSEAECEARGGNPLVGYGWGRAYAGCSPLKERLVYGRNVPRVIEWWFD
ncbi:MAG: hypothetical protein ACO1OB_34195 [Archangium sp.]